MAYHINNVNAILYHINYCQTSITVVESLGCHLTSIALRPASALACNRVNRFINASDLTLCFSNACISFLVLPSASVVLRSLKSVLSYTASLSQ